MVVDIRFQQLFAERAQSTPVPPTPVPIPVPMPTPVPSSSLSTPVPFLSAPPISMPIPIPSVYVGEPQSMLPYPMPSPQPQIAEPSTRPSSHVRQPSAGSSTVMFVVVASPFLLCPDVIQAISPPHTTTGLLRTQRRTEEDCGHDLVVLVVPRARRNIGPRRRGQERARPRRAHARSHRGALQRRPLRHPLRVGQIARHAARSARRPALPATTGHGVGQLLRGAGVPRALRALVRGVH